MPFKAKEVLQRLQRASFAIRRQSGSHVAMHSKDIPIGTFRSILKRAGITEEEFRNL